MTKKIAIVAGGNSGEFGISMKSAGVIKQSLDTKYYEVYLITIKGSEWFYTDENGKKFNIDKNDFSLPFGDKKIFFDIVFNAIHGTPGENGKLPAYFEMLGIPFTSSGFYSSALTFNKNFCNRLVSSLGIETAPSVHFYKGEQTNTEQILKKISLPCFVKPNCGGSSVGMSKVNRVSELNDAIAKAFAEDEEILIEQYIEGRELTCGVIKHKGRMIVFPVTEIVSKKEYFDFESKYDPQLAKEILPADITNKVEINCKSVSSYLYERLNCRGVVRFDYILSHADKLYFLEVNTVPGFTMESIVPKMALEMGISLSELFTMMIEDALWRKQDKWF